MKVGISNLDHTWSYPEKHAVKQFDAHLKAYNFVLWKLFEGTKKKQLKKKRKGSNADVSDTAGQCTHLLSIC